MKNKILKIAFAFILFSVMFVTASFAVEIKEDVANYSAGAYIIGSTRFEPDVTITASLAANAGVNEAKVNLFLYGNISNLKVAIYSYDSDFEEWNEVKEDGTTRLLETSEVETLEENLNIFFVNNEEKVLEISYDETVDEDSIWSPDDNVTFENGKFYVPVLTECFSFLSNNVANNVNTNVIESVINGEDVVQNVEIIPEWAEFAANGKYYTADSFDEVLANEEELEIKLLADIDLPTALEIDKKVTVDLNSWNLTVKEDTAGDGVFHVIEGGDLTINGDGVVDGVGKNKWNIVVFADGGKVTINGGLYTNINTEILDDDTDSNHFDVIYAKGNGSVVINGGYFAGKTPAWLLNLNDESRETASIVVKGGTFTGLNPANSKAEGEGTNFVADGYKVEANIADNVYTVVEVDESDVILADGIACEDLQTAVNTALNVTLLKDIELTTTVVVNKTVTLDLNGHTIKNETDIWNETTGDWSLISVREGGNLTINGEGTLKAKEDDCYAIDVQDGGEITINNGEVIGNVSAVYVKNGTATINGGTYSIQQLSQQGDYRYTLNCWDANYKTGDAKIIVNGGTFIEFDPVNNLAEGEGTNFVAEGYYTECNGNNEFSIVRAPVSN